MISMRNLIKFALENRSHVWIDVILVKETPKVILIIFDDRKVWIPKAWLCRIKRNKSFYAIASSSKAGEARLLGIDSLAVGQAISIQLSEYHWVKKIW